MGKDLRSGKHLRSPKGKPTPRPKGKTVSPPKDEAAPPKKRVVSIDDDYTPTSPERWYYPPADPTYRQPRTSIPTSPTPTPPPTNRQSRVTKRKQKNPKGSSAGLKAAVGEGELAAAQFFGPGITIKRRPSSIKSRFSSETSLKGSPSKKVSFDDGKDVVEISSDDEFEEPLTNIFKNSGRRSAGDVRSQLQSPRSASNPRPSATPRVKAKTNVAKGTSNRRSPASGEQKESTPEELHEEQISWAQVDADSASLLEDLLESPRLISLNDISACFYHLQIQTRSWAEAHFKFDLKNDQSRDAWPLHDLRTKYIALFKTTQYIADGSQYGWRRFFTNPESRFCLVYGIVGEYAKEHIFKHTAFGFTEQENKELERIDKEEIHQDGFLRNKLKAKVIKDMFESVPQEDRMAELDRQIDDLADGLFQIIEPLMPTECFDYDETTKQWHVKDDEPALARKAIIADQLREILKKCVSLHWAIRFAGSEGYVVRFAMHQPKGSDLHDTAPFVCLNKQMMKDTAHHGGDDKGRVRKIRMTCWGRVEAYIGHGKGYDELAEIEHDYRRTHGMLKEKKDAVKDEDDIKEEEDVKMEDDSELTDEEDLFDWDNADKWYYSYHKKHIQPRLPEGAAASWARHIGKKPEEMGDIHSAYVQQHKFMCLHDVYCEWDQEDDDGFSFNTKIAEVKEQPMGMTQDEIMADEVYGLPVPKKERLTLKAAVEQARRERHVIKHKIEDLKIATWNHVMHDYWGRYETGLWVSLGLAGCLVAAKIAKGLSWGQMARMSKARITALAKYGWRVVKFSGQTLRKTAELLWEMVYEGTDELWTIVKKIRKDGWPGFQIEMHTREMKKLHPGDSLVEKIPFMGSKTTQKASRVSCSSGVTTSEAFWRAFMRLLRLDTGCEDAPAGPVRT